MERPWVFLGLALGSLVGSWNASALCQQAKPRPLAPGVLINIPIDQQPRDTASLPMPLPKLNATQFDPQTVANTDTLFGKTRRVILYRDNIWQYEFSFTGLRQAKLRTPTGGVGFVERNVWYMVYRIRDTGKTMTLEAVKQNPDFEHLNFELRRDKKIDAEKKKFLPSFSLEGWIANDKGNDYQRVAYRDQVDPIAVEQIRNLEDPNQRLLDTHQMSKVEIPIAKNDTDPGVWGVAVWKDVDPRLDYVSVFIKGLSNAYRLGSSFEEPVKRRTLQLNFWRPGDSVSEPEDNVKYGIPLVSNPTEQALICERYDLPGPLIRAYFRNKIAKREVLVVETDAQVNLVDFKSALSPQLDQGQMPATIRQSFAAAGIAIDNGVAVNTVIAGKRWRFKQGEDDYEIALEPQFWEPTFEGIRFIKSLDHLWIYR